VTEKLHKSEPVSHKEVEEQVGAAARMLFERMGFSPSATQINDFFALNQSLPPKEQLPKAVEIAMRFAFGAAAREHSKSVKTRADLAKVLRDINEAAEIGPTLSRHALKEIQRNLPRPGGPGRRRKFSDEDCGKLCDEINLQVRQGLNVTKAIDKMATSCPDLIGNTISVRKLKDIWKKRNEFPSKSS
jgi:hypothetical protein